MRNRGKVGSLDLSLPHGDSLSSTSVVGQYRSNLRLVTHARMPGTSSAV
jgi:hypothetical protein